MGLGIWRKRGAVNDKAFLINQQILQAAYQAFNLRDLDGALAFMHADVDWANGMTGGRVRGRAAVQRYWAEQWAVIDPHVEPVDFTLDETGRMVVNVHQVVRDRNGNTLVDQMVQHVYWIEDGLIRQMEIGQE